MYWSNFYILLFYLKFKNKGAPLSFLIVNSRIKYNCSQNKIESLDFPKFDFSHRLIHYNQFTNFLIILLLLLCFLFRSSYTNESFKTKTYNEFTLSRGTWKFGRYLLKFFEIWVTSAVKHPTIFILISTIVRCYLRKIHSFCQLLCRCCQNKRLKNSYTTLKCVSMPVELILQNLFWSRHHARSKLNSWIDKYAVATLNF